MVSIKIDKERIFKAYGYRCAISGKDAHDLHHVKPQTKINRKRWPLFIDSVFNLVPVNHDVHMSQPLIQPPSDLICDLYEEWLVDLANEEYWPHLDYPNERK